MRRRALSCGRDTTLTPKLNRGRCRWCRGNFDRARATGRVWADLLLHTLATVCRTMIHFPHYAPEVRSMPLRCHLGCSGVTQCNLGSRKMLLLEGSFLGRTPYCGAPRTPMAMQIRNWRALPRACLVFMAPPMRCVRATDEGGDVLTDSQLARERGRTGNLQRYSLENIKEQRKTCSNVSHLSDDSQIRSWINLPSAYRFISNRFPPQSRRL